MGDLVYSEKQGCLYLKEVLGLCQQHEQLRAVIPGYLHHSSARFQQPASRGPVAAGRHERASLRQLRLSARCILLSFTPLPFSLSPAKCVAGLRCCLQGADSKWAWGEEPKPEYLQKMQFIAKGRAAAGHSPPGWTRRGTPEELHNWRRRRICLAKSPPARVEVITATD